MINIQNLSFGFKDNILKDINLNIENNGQIIALLGPNGSGKTTFLNVLANLYQRYVGIINKSYEVFFLPDCSFIPEDLTIDKCLTEFSYLYTNFNHARAIDMLNYLKIDKQKKISEYSKGMKEQLHLIMTLAQNVDLYLLDEPLANVDPLTRDILLKLILDFRSNDSVMIISTHLVNDMNMLFDEIIMMNSGQVILYDSISGLCDKYDNLNLDDIYKEINRNVNIN